MRGDKRNGQFSAGEEHREIFYSAAGGEEFGLTRERKPNLVHVRLMDRPGDDSVDFACQGELHSFFQRGRAPLARLPASVCLTSVRWFRR